VESASIDNGMDFSVCGLARNPSGYNLPMQIGPYRIEPALVLAPMAGVTDLPFRRLCRRMGAGLAPSEMTTADPTLWHTEKSRLRVDHRGEAEPISVQIAGYDPQMLADAAVRNVEQGAQIIDINMGCPAKKVCKRDAGSALMKDEALVADICSAVVRAVDVPVTLKIRTGWARAHRNGPTIARIAQNCGIQALAVHGRTREDHYEGAAEYDTIAAIKSVLSIPVIANGDVLSPAAARAVLDHTKADALMIGRGALGQPWIFREIGHFLATGRELAPPTLEEVRAILMEHIAELHAFYGQGRGVRVARKHIQWYCQSHPQAGAFWPTINRVEDAAMQLGLVDDFLRRSAALPLAA
jgi:tRNA-dihydrouridine synthase B